MGNAECLSCQNPAFRIPNSITRLPCRSPESEGRLSGPIRSISSIDLSSFLLQQFVNAIFLGSIYSLIALGYTMVYGIIELINFAHGELFTAGAFIGLIVLTALQQIG